MTFARTDIMAAARAVLSTSQRATQRHSPKALPHSGVADQHSSIAAMGCIVMKQLFYSHPREDAAERGHSMFRRDRLRAVNDLHRVAHRRRRRSVLYCVDAS